MCFLLILLCSLICCAISGDSLIESNDDNKGNIDSNNLTLLSEPSPYQDIELIGEIKASEATFNNQTDRTTNSSVVNESKVDCTLVNLTESEIPQVKMVDSEHFLEYISPKENNSICALALFYYPWCTFSTKISRDFNAIGRLFPQLNVIALNAYQYNSINMRFGIVGVPTILFFHNGKIMAKYNLTDSDLLSLVAFIYRLTGLRPDPSINQTDDDWRRMGLKPLFTSPQPSIDYVLILASVFLLFAVCYLIVRSAIFKKTIQSIRGTWRGGADHQHVD